MPFVTTEAFDSANLGIELANVASLSGAKMGLVTAVVAWGKQTTIAQLTEAAYTGYARQTIVWGPVVRDQAGFIGSTAALLRWAATGMFPAVITGWFVVFGATPLLLGGNNFPITYTLSDAFSEIDTVLEFIEPNHQLTNTVVTQ